MARRKRAAPPPRDCCGSDVKPFETTLSQCLLLDPFPPSGAIHDVDPFGVYQTRTDGQVVFKQHLRCAPGYVPCRTPRELDALLVRVFLAATRHSRRHMVVTRDYVRSFVGGRGGRLFAGVGPSLANVEGCYISEGMPPNVILCVDACLPEDLGKLCYHCGTYGVSLMDPYRVCSVQVVPVPFGCGGGDSREEVLTLPGAAP